MASLSDLANMTLSQITAEQERVVQGGRYLSIDPKSSPAALAEYASEGLWKPARHLVMLDQHLLMLAERKIRKLMVFMPPRHGKSMLCSEYFPAWWLGTFPQQRVLLTSYEADFASQWGRKSRDVLETYGSSVFDIRVSADSSAAYRWDLKGYRGGMQTAGAGGAITGKGGDLLVIDDPVKNEQDANSETSREHKWDWFRATVRTRMQANAVVLFIMTRWHEDDLAGRILRETPEGWTILSLPALAEENDALGRQPGEALWPEMFTTETLKETQRDLGSYFWNALYQQRPAPTEGGLFKRDWMSQFADAVPIGCERIRYWDKAGTENGGDWTAGVLIARSPDGRFFVEDVVRGQWSALSRERVIRQTAEMDLAHHQTTYGAGSMGIYYEQEGGSGGKESAYFTTVSLAGFDAHADPVTGDKTVRARPLAAQFEAGNVWLVRDIEGHRWNREYISELASFPHGAHDDQVDASSGSFNKLQTRKKVQRVAQVIRR